MSETHNSSLPETLQGIPFLVCSEPMQQLLRVVQRVAQTNSAVLIAGESGTGKELIARAIHHYSLRCTKPWVDINCAALPDQLMESELFGYEKGAFSGADTPKRGLFELADTGTLFLDEIGELDPKMQVKFLRVLDGVPYYRLGGVRKISVDVRIVAATNEDLEQGIAGGRFRRDLFYRLSQIQLTVPPLRARVEDIVPLAEHFLRGQNPQAFLAPDAQEALQRYAWPGNVRELRNVVAKASLLANSNKITASDLPAKLRSSAGACNNGSCNPTTRLRRMEQQMILQALEETSGHQGKAAELLGISRRTLSRKLKHYGVEEAPSVSAK